MTILVSNPGAWYADTDTQLSNSQCIQLKAAGFIGVIRYLSRFAGQASGDLGKSEMANIFGAGLSLGAVQHCPKPGWAPTIDLGSSYGINAVHNATSLGLETGMTIWLDWEGALRATLASQAIGYINQWAKTVASAGYRPGLYVGFNQILDGEQLYVDLVVQAYWRSASTVPDIPVRGYCMQQFLAAPIDGIEIDRNVVMRDAFGGTPFVMASP